MRGKRMFFAGLATITLISAVLFLLSGRSSAVPSSVPLEIKPQIYYMQSTTDATGHFSIDHNLETNTGGSKTIISGVIVSIKSGANNNWYTLNSTSEYDSRIAWTAKGVNGFIDNAAYNNQPVRIMVFTFKMVN